MSDIDINKYPDSLWVYNRNQKYETRDYPVVVGNIEYTRKDPDTITIPREPVSFEWTDELHASFEGIGTPDINKITIVELQNLFKALQDAALPQPPKEGNDDE